MPNALQVQECPSGATGRTSRKERPTIALSLDTRAYWLHGYPSFTVERDVRRMYRRENLRLQPNKLRLEYLLGLSDSMQQLTMNVSLVENLQWASPSIERRVIKT